MEDREAKLLEKVSKMKLDVVEIEQVVRGNGLWEKVWPQTSRVTNMLGKIEKAVHEQVVERREENEGAGAEGYAE